MKSVAFEKKLSPLRSANKAEVAEFYDVTISTIEAWIRRGCPVVQRGRRGSPWILDLLAIAEWRYGATKDDDEVVDPDHMSPKDRKDWYDGEKRRREIQVEDRELIPSSDYEQEYSRMIKLVAAGLETLPDILERDAGLDRKQMDPAFRVVDGLRESLYQSLVNRNEG